MTDVNPIPHGLRSITPAMSIDGASDAIAFYVKAFGAEEVSRAPDPSGKKVWHAAVKFGDSQFFINDVFPEMGATAHVSRLWFYTEDLDSLFARAVAAGAKVKMPPTDMFWGDRMGCVIDPWGNEITLAKHIKDIKPEDMQAAQDTFVAEQAAKK